MMQVSLKKHQPDLARAYSTARSTTKLKWRDLLAFSFWLAGWAILCVTPVFSQTQAAGGHQKPGAAVQQPESPKPAETGQSEPAVVPEEQEVLPGDWGPELLYNILSSQNEEAREALNRAAFAAGSAVVLQLE